MPWLTEHLGWAAWIAGLSLAACTLGILAVRVLVVWIPAEYFVENRASYGFAAQCRPLTRWTLLLLKNALGLVFLLAGLTMLVTPGPGILSILLSLSLLDFPGKRALELRLVRSPRVLHSINSLRHKAGKPPLRLPE